MIIHLKLLYMISLTTLLDNMTALLEYIGLLVFDVLILFCMHL